jgi:hypothetical protein
VFEVKWKGYDKMTTEPQNLLMKDIPDLVKAFEKDINFYLKVVGIGQFLR